ncbi:aminodeoxychorismate lyase [soil metagenome]
MIGQVLIDGECSDVISVTDSTVVRGDGCFEAIRSYAGVCFRVSDHLDRLERSAAALHLEAPPRRRLEQWVADMGAAGGDCIVRIVITRGGALPGAAGPGRCIVITHPVPERADSLRLAVVPAPWHPAGRSWGLAGVKTTSYAPHMAASRQAVECGFDDALLVSDIGIVLEGPTFTVGWCRSGRVYTPSLSLGILASVTRRVVMEITEVAEVEEGLDDVGEADEVFAMSTVKEVVPVVAVGEMTFPPGEITRTLAQRLSGLVRSADSH